MKRLLFGAVAVILAAALFLPGNAGALSAQKAIVLDGTTGRILFEKDAHSQSLIASTTKIMTALVVCEHCNVLDRMRIPKEALGIEGSSMYLQEGEVLTVQELLYGLMLRSGNDAAVALAIYCGGTVEGFVQLMNDKARALGLKNTHFANPNGLDAPQHYSSAYDLAVLTAYAMENPIFRQTVSTKNVTVGQRTMQNHNKLLWQMEGAEGVKTGYTRAAGRILVSSVSRDGRRLIAVTIHAPDDWRDHAVLLEQGFRDFRQVSVIRQGQRLGSVEVAAGTEKYAQLLAAEELVLSLADHEKVSIELPGCGFVFAPVAAGDHAGFAQVLIDGKPVKKVPLVYGQTVEIAAAERRSVLEKLFGGDGR